MEAACGGRTPGGGGEEAGGGVKDLGFPYPPDTRPHGCPEPESDDVSSTHSDTVSIIIPWLKEKWKHLDGTLRALLHFTPDHLVEEYLFVSDGNKDSKEKDWIVLCTGYPKGLL